MRILVDAMGGDNAPGEIVRGCVDAVKSNAGFDITLIGDSNEIHGILKKESFDGRRIDVRHASEVITNTDKPTEAIKNKKDSSMVVGFRMLSDKEGDALLSAGNSGALLTASLLLAGRLKGVLRPALGAIIPTKAGETLLIDAGLNSAVRPESYVQFARFGNEYMKALYSLENPEVGLVNIGEEDGKGTAEVKEANELLKKAGLNYVGNMEGGDIINGKARIVVCDGFVGNVLLKFLEGTGVYFLKSLKEIFHRSLRNKIAGSVLRQDLREFFRPMDADVVGGAPVLGINGLVIKSHGSSKAVTIKNVIAKTVRLVDADIVRHIELNLEGGM
ncbi:MAG: phosphate acyltransferase PlsX [Clostridia bacterium]|nr:phosphate acyltransferase PlsX [Clostridia bacterium]